MHCPACQHDNQATARFCQACGTRLDVASVVTAERRQVTVVFCDLVESTALSHRIDPEELRDLVHAYHELCTREIVGVGGHVAQYLGDGVLAYFGYPKAQEHAAERAIRTALDIVNEVERIQRPDGLPLQARVGVATGLVVGEAGGASAEREQTVVGDTPNLAARLQALAAPGSVLVGPTTRQLTGEFFEYASVGEHAIKGFADPVPVWKVVRERNIESRFAAARGAFAGPIVARERELAFLADSWQRAARGSWGNRVDSPGAFSGPPVRPAYTLRGWRALRNPFDDFDTMALDRDVRYT
jgi:class 3 adenylate cyclase